MKATSPALATSTPILLRRGTSRMRVRSWIMGLALLIAASEAQAELACPGRGDALGTARVLAVDAATTPRVGRKHFPQTLPLRPKEVVLTFDDGPQPGPTDQVLAVLKAECVRAAFFLLGQSALAHPALARRELA